MRKSVFFKYIAAFVVIILISFLLLTLINNGLLRNYAIESKIEDAKRTARIASETLTFTYRSSSPEWSFPEYVSARGGTVKNLLSRLVSESKDQIIYVTDASGNVLLCATLAPQSSSDTSLEKLPSAVLDELGSANGGIHVELGTLGATFTQKRITVARSITDEDGTVVGALFFSESTIAEDMMIASVNRAIFTASLWVMLASIIAVYFISDRIVSPLRTVTKTVKEYGKGNLKARVPVRGVDEISELGNAFNSMAESLEQTEKMRNAFLANISHDLRTPMTTIAGFVDGMLSGAIPEEKHGEYLEIVSSEVHRLSRLVGQLLDISRVESGERKFTHKSFDICEMARLILISFEQKIEDKRLEIRFDADSDSMFAYSDSDAIHQVLYNLIDNALKFARDEGLLRIRITRKEAGKLQVSVYNEGVGIPKEDLPFIFDRFYKTDKSRGLDKTGTGLGLYIVKTILEALHEQITVESSEGEFCEFHFTIAEERI